MIERDKIELTNLEKQEDISIDVEMWRKE